MGYPLKETTLYSFFKLFFELHENYGEYGFPFDDAYEFCKTTHSLDLLKLNQPRIDHWIENSNLNFITSEELINKNSIGSLLFSTFKGVEDFLDRIIKITSSLKVQFLKHHEQDFQIETCNQFLSVFNSLLNRFHQFNFMNSLTDIKIIFELLVEQELSLIHI